VFALPPAYSSAYGGRQIIAQEPLTITDHGSFLLVAFFGEFSVEAGKECVDRMVAVSMKYGRAKVLLDCRRMTGDLHVFDRFQVAEYGATKRFQLQQLALVRPRDTAPPDNLVQTVAVNRGMNLRLFMDFDDAVRWLSELAPAEENAPDNS